MKQVVRTLSYAVAFAALLVAPASALEMSLSAKTPADSKAICGRVTVCVGETACRAGTGGT